MKRFALILMAAGLAACGANRNERHVEIHDALSSTIYSNQSASDGDATVTIVRDPGLYGGGCSSGVYLDDKVVANMEQNDRLVLHVPSGSRKIGLLAHGACERNQSAVEASLNPGDDRSFRISSDGTSIAPADGQAAASAPPPANTAPVPRASGS